MSLAPLQTVRFLLRHPLTREQPWPSVLRYVRWQLASRLAMGPMAIDFVNDARLLVRPGMTGATGNVYVGLHEFEDMAFVLHALRPEDCFVDVGANIGSYTVLAAKAVGARVVAFEPIATTFRHLLDNIALNSIVDRVDARQMCVGRSSGTVTMTNDQDTVNHVVIGNESATTAAVPLTSLDEALGGRIPFMIKLDVEGYELDVLQGATRTLADPRVQCLIMEINDSGDRYGRTAAELLAHTAALGFTRCTYSPAQRRLLASDASPGANAILVRDLNFVQQRVDQARRFRVLNQEV